MKNLLCSCVRMLHEGIEVLEVKNKVPSNCRLPIITHKKVNKYNLTDWHRRIREDATIQRNPIMNNRT